MALPAIIWRNPKSINRRRLWNRARRDELSSVYVVVRSGEHGSIWEGLPNLEMIEGGAPNANAYQYRQAQSRR